MKLFPAALIVSFLCGLSLSVLAQRNDWPEFRGPEGQGHSVAKNVPTEWSAKKNIKWRVAIAGRGWSSPVIVADRLYLTTAVADSAIEPISLRALCLETSSGKTLWDVEVFRHPPSTLTKSLHEKNSYASPTPLVRDGRIYVHFGHLGTAALELNGKVLWRQTEVKYLPVHGNGGSPVLEGNSLIFSCDGATNPFVVALNATTGAVQWVTPRDTPARQKFSFSTPLAITVEGQRQIISPGSGFVGAYDPATGKELWRVLYDTGFSVIPRPVFAHGLLFVSSGYDRPTLFAIRPAGAKGDATATSIAWNNKRSAPHTPSVLVVGDEVYFVSDNGIASCADAKTGAVNWVERLGGTFSASPLFADGKIYFLNEDGLCTVIKPGKTFQRIAQNDLDEATLASPAVTDGALFIRSQGNLWRIGK
jgi:outer membrane protein assembly factor BamB